MSEKDLYEDEMECWVANQNSIFLLFWFLFGFFVTLFIFIPSDTYHYIKNKVRRKSNAKT